MRVTVIGTGFVGVVTAAVLASFNNEVFGLDIDEKKVASLTRGEVPFFEPGLSELLKQEIASGRLHFTTDYAKAIPGSQVVMVAVGTPSAPDGTADLIYVKKACESLAPHLDPQTVVAIKSTVPPGTLDILRPVIEAKAKSPFIMASLPEFLREGSAVEDTLHPSRVVLGCDDPHGREILTELHQPFAAPIILVSPSSAQMGKYASNAYLATRITFINQMADLCEQNGADVEEVIRVIGEDERIGKHYWYPGLGYGGSCFPKDVRELAAYSRSVGLGNNLFNKVNELNEERVFQKFEEFEKQVGGWDGKRVAVLGLSFKKHTDDMREAPSTKVVPHLLQKGARVVGFDPLAINAAKSILPQSDKLTYADSIADAIRDADAVIALVEWPEIVAYDFAGAPGKGRFFIDARNQFDLQQLEQAGWRYLGIGRRKTRYA